MLIASCLIIKYLNIIEGFRSLRYTGLEDVATDFLLLQTAKEGLNGDLIITVASATHSSEQEVAPRI